MVPSIKRFIQRRGDFEGCLIGDPRWIPLIDLVPEVPSLLRLTDDPCSFSSMPRSIKALIGSALKKEIPVVVTSKGLLDFLKQNYHFPNAHYLPNGVVQEDFFPLATEEPADLRKIPHPRVLYVGKIDERIDKIWVEEAARRLPEVAFIFIGPVINKLPKRPNLFCLGSRPYASMRGYFSFADAAMIPFQKTPRTDAMSSIKLLQYLAAGLPVVVPKLREIEEQRAPVLFADSPSSFVEKLKEAILLGRKDYRAFLTPYNWESNREYLEALLRM